MTASPNTALRLASTTPPPWDDRQFRWALRDSGLLAALKPAAAKVLWQAYCMANTAGEFDLPIAWVAGQLELTERAVSTARTRLEELGLLQCIGTSAHSPQIGRYMLITPQKQAAPPRDQPESAPAFTPPPLNVRSGDPRTCVPVTPERTFTQSVPEKRKEKEAAACAREAADDRGLFDGRSPYDAAAAALLVRHCRMTAQEAKGYVSQYRPTAANVRAIVANIAARRRAAALGQERTGIRDCLAFTRSAIRRGEWSVDDRVARMRATGRRRAAAATAKRAAAREAALRAQQAHNTSAATVAAWEALTDADRVALLGRAVDNMPQSMRRHYVGKSIDSPMVRAAILNQLEREQRA